MRARLSGLATRPTPELLWQRDGRQVLIDAASLEVRSVDGWIVCDIDVRCDQTGPAKLQFVFYLGEKDDGDGVHAAGTIAAPQLAAAQLADVWGSDLQRVLWDAVLDVVEVSVARAATGQSAGHGDAQRLSLRRAGHHRVRCLHGEI